MKIKESEKINKYLDLVRELKNHEVALETVPQKKPGRNGNQTKNRDHPDYSIVEIGQNTEKSPEDLMRLAVTWSQVKFH